MAAYIKTLGSLGGSAREKARQRMQGVQAEQSAKALSYRLTRELRRADALALIARITARFGSETPERVRAFVIDTQRYLQGHPERGIAENAFDALTRIACVQERLARGEPYDPAMRRSRPRYVKPPRPVWLDDKRYLPKKPPGGT